MSSAREERASEAAFHRVAVVDAWDETPTLRGVRLDLGPLSPAHARPGQVGKLRACDCEAYFAIATAPSSDGACELLVKRGTPVADALAAAAPGTLVEVTAPFGDGFPADAARGRDVLLFAAGSGITPVRALMQWLLAQRCHGKLALFYGQRSDADFAYVREHDRWRADGVHLVLCASQPTPRWSGARGYVQTVADELRLHQVATENAVAFLCGMRPMVDDVRRVLQQYGLPPERIFLNI
ncbi:MAG TPA: oxidoreductase [Polyangia bacterium]|nr:oxidoreductase [Polyangia bacterium]